MCGRGHGRRKVGMADPVEMADLVFLDRESLAGMEDPGSRQDLEIPGLGLPEAGLQSVAARKAWTEYHPHAEFRMVWL